MSRGYRMDFPPVTALSTSGDDPLHFTVTLIAIDHLHNLHT